ncbi:MAG: energy-coupling factor ABC transporter ATP-binding protein, partial [Armatimonadetes bacterium]|nr:energy-coupling factor ABC transporter ATP-binding protein [Armatimonadota bacterium]
ERAMNALRHVGMEHAMHRSPHQLSFGERKRVAIATVLAMNPEIIALDEPTSNLDPRSRRSLISLLRSLNITKVIATHDLDIAIELCTRVVVMDKGEVIADGDATAILSDGELMEAHGLEIPLKLLITRFQQ